MKILLMLLLVSCASPKFHETRVEEFKYKEIDHQQKVYVGQEKADVLKRFGAPDKAQEVVLGYDHDRLEIEYFYKIWCASPSCRVYIDQKTGLVTSFVNFRFEFTETLK